MAGIEHIMFDNISRAKAVSIFNTNLEDISKHLANSLNYDRPPAPLAVHELKEPTIDLPDDPNDVTNVVLTANGPCTASAPKTSRVGGWKTCR